jgi:hypothetical protein
MATNKDFIVKNGLQVGGDIVVTGSLQTAGLTLPASDGTSGQVIVTDGSGNLSFQSVTTNAFSRIEVNGQTAITTDQVGDTLSFVAGDNITITTDEPNDAITISASQYTDAEAVDAVEAAEHLTIDGGTLYVDTANNYVGIGDTSPQHKLDVAGGIGISGTEVITSAGQIVGPVADSALTIGGSLTGNLSKVAVVYSPTEPSSPIQGQFYFDSLNQKMKVYTGSAWIDAVPAGSGGGGGGDVTDAVATFEKYQYTTSSVTNAVSGSDDNGNTLSYIVDGSQNVEVFVNGIKQYEGATADYVATTGSSVTFTYNLPSGSVVDVQVYELLTQDAFYLKSETYTKTETNTQISTAVSSYVPLSGGIMTGDLTTKNLTIGNTVSSNNSTFTLQGSRSTLSNDIAVINFHNKFSSTTPANISVDGLGAIKFKQGESEIIRISSTGDIRSTGNIAIGGIGYNPQAALHINAPGIPQVLLDAGSDSTGDIVVPDGEVLQIGHWNNSTSTYSRRITVSAAGNIAIGNISDAGESTAQSLSAEAGNGVLYAPWVNTSCIEARNELGSGSCGITIGEFGAAGNGESGVADEIGVFTDGKFALKVRGTHSNNSVATVEVIGESYTTVTGSSSAVPNSGAMNFKIVGDSDGLAVYNLAGGDYSLCNIAQGNGIIFYDGGGGMRGYYNNVQQYECNASGFSTTSDIRLKETIGDLSIDATGIVNNLQLIAYHPKSNQHDKHGDHNETIYGFSAQELYALDNNLVSKGADDLDDDTEKLGSYAVKTTSMHALLLKALQESNNKISELEARIQMLENK